jgi:hypothetical protein
MSKASYQISDAERETYNRDGALVLRGVIDTSWLDRLSSAIERDIAEPGPYFHGYVPEDGKGHFHGNLKIWQNDPDFRALCLESGLANIAEQLFQSSKVNLLYD